LTKVLVVDDDPKILKVVDHSLRREGYEIYTAADGEQAVEMAGRIKPDLIVLDLMLPKLNGFEVCRKIKNGRDVPIIILSARGDEIDKIMGFTLGVDDYQTKPFSPAELLMRVKAVLRRSANAVTEGQPKGEPLAYPGLQVNRSKREVITHGSAVELTAKEFELLWLLASHPNQVFTRAQLLEQIWDISFLGEENTVTVHIRRLREKIEKDPGQPEFIKTIWGVGYKFETS
jgi:DNA-binding response OmpR family regulator